MMRHLRFKQYTKNIWAYNHDYVEIFKDLCDSAYPSTGKAIFLSAIFFILGIPLCSLVVILALVVISEIFKAIYFIGVSTFFYSLSQLFLILVILGYAIIFSLFFIWPVSILIYGTIRCFIDRLGFFSSKNSYVLNKYPNKPENLIGGAIFGFLDDSKILNNDNKFILESKNPFSHMVEIIDVSPQHVKYKLKTLDGTIPEFHEINKHEIISLGSGHYTCTKKFFLNYYNFTGEYNYDYA